MEHPAIEAVLGLITLSTSDSRAGLTVPDNVQVPSLFPHNGPSQGGDMQYPGFPLHSR